MAKIRIDGTWFEWEEPNISGEKVRQFMRTRGSSTYDDSREFSFTTQRTKTQDPLPDQEEVPIDQDAVVQLTSFPRNTHYGTDVSRLQSINDFRNLSLREKFILSQVFQVSERYYFRNNNSLYLNKECNFLVIRDFPLPPSGDWMGRTTTICIYFPKNYPKSPPSGFFVDARLQHRGTGENHLFRGSGIYKEPDAFFKKHSLEKKGYGFYCWVVDQSWHPNLENPFVPDNLDSYLKIAFMAFDFKAAANKKKVTRIS